MEIWDVPVKIMGGNNQHSTVIAVDDVQTVSNDDLLPLSFNATWCILVHWITLNEAPNE